MGCSLSKSMKYHPLLINVPRGGVRSWDINSWDIIVDLPPPPRDIKLGDVYFIKMFAFVVGVACGAQKCLYVTPKMTFSRYF